MTVDLLTGKQYAPRPTDCCTKAGPVLHQRPASHTPDQRPRCQAMAATPGERPMRGRERQPWSMLRRGRLGDIVEPRLYSASVCMKSPQFRLLGAISVVFTRI